MFVFWKILPALFSCNTRFEIHPFAFRKIFLALHSARCVNNYLKFCLLICYQLIFYVWLYLITTKRSGNVKQNPGPKYNRCQRFFICLWNFINNWAHSFIKRAYTTIHKFNTVCLSETYLRASISNDNGRL